MPSQDDALVTLHDGPGAAALAPGITALYGRAWADRAAVSDFYLPDHFAARFARYTRDPGFALALATDSGDEPVGMMFGAVLTAGSPWWENLRAEVDDDFTVEDGHRTFGVNDLSVTPGRRGEGIARRLHDTLLGGQTVRRAALLVRPDNTTARHAYTRWGWTGIGTRRPRPAMPDYLVMIRPLPL